MIWMCSIHSSVHCVSSSSRSHGSSLTNMDLTPSPVPSSTKHLPKTPTVSSIFHQATRSRKSLPGSNLRCDDGGKARIRQDWDQMTVSSQQLFIDAMEEAISRGFFQRFLQYHADLHSSIQSHLTCGFILWHRRFLLGMENMLRSLDLKYRCLTIPYWNVMEHYKNQENEECDSFGSCSCIIYDLGGTPEPNSNTTRTYANVTATGVLHNQSPLMHLFDQTNEPGIVRNDLSSIPLPESASYANVFSMYPYTQDNYGEFGHVVQGGIHDDIHGVVGGFMPTYSSPTDPLFLVWHSFIDLLLYTWEICYIPNQHTKEAGLTFDPFRSFFGTGASSCAYTENVRAPLFPCMNATSDIHMQFNSTKIVHDLLIGRFFDDIGMEFQTVSMAENLGEHEFTYDRNHLSDELRTFLNDKGLCPHGGPSRFGTEEDANAHVHVHAAADADVALEEWIHDVRKELGKIYADEPHKVNSHMSFLYCTLGGSKEIPSAEFRQQFLEGTDLSIFGDGISDCGILLQEDEDE